MSHPRGRMTIGNEARRGYSVPQHRYLTRYSIKTTPSRGGWDIALVRLDAVGPSFPDKVTIIKAWRDLVRTVSPDCPYYVALRAAYELRAELNPMLPKKVSKAGAFLSWRKRKTDAAG